ncbi:MAG: twin-arginine translocase subunit TatC [Thermoleophilaceae bacterium]
MARRIKPVGHEEHLTVVDHLDELRSRIIVSLLAIGVAFGLCAWQSDLILDVLKEPIGNTLGGKEPVTLGVAEQFTTTLTVSLYAAILIALPVVLYQAYAFVLPAFSPTERKVALPLLLMVPVLFIGGVLFCYFVVLSPAIDFLLSFNGDQFDTQLRAREYFSFVALSMIAMGLLFQVPVGILALTRLGIVTPRQLRRNRRYAILGCAVLAALLPTIDPVTLILEMIPLIILYELSILLAQAFGTPAEVAEPPEPAAEGSQ